jgi:glucose uptake protein GlcU
MDTHALAQGIQLSVAPVFMLTAVAALINAFSQRLSRIIDRGRTVADAVDEGEVRNLAHAREELRLLRKRARLVNAALALLAVSAMLISVTTGLLFLGETQTAKLSIGIPISFLGALTFFVAAVFLYLLEVWMSTYIFRFGKEPFETRIEASSTPPNA